MEPARTKKEAYLVEGMSCSGCERTVQKVVSSLEGVKFTKAEFASASLTVEYDPSTVTVDQIKSAVNKVGYKFVGEKPTHGQRESSDEGVA